jgi:hypothetical protein
VFISRGMNSSELAKEMAQDLFLEGKSVAQVRRELNKMGFSEHLQHGELERLSYSVRTAIDFNAREASRGGHCLARSFGVIAIIMGICGILLQVSASDPVRVWSHCARPRLHSGF